MKTQEDYIKEIADRINNANAIEIENPTVEDIKNLKDFDYILAPAKYFPVIIRREFKVLTVLGIPTVFWSDLYEVGDTVMGCPPCTFTAEEALEAYSGYCEDEESDCFED